MECLMTMDEDKLRIICRKNDDFSINKIDA